MTKTKTKRAYDAYRDGELSRQDWQKLVKQNGLAVAKNMSVSVVVKDGYI